MTRPRGPGGFDLNSMMKQLQQVQADMAAAQEKLKDETVDASAGGGMVKVKMSGDLRLLEIAIDPDRVETNILFFRVTGEPASAFSRRMAEAGVLAGAGGGSIRMVTHYGIERGHIEETLDRLKALTRAAVAV